MSAAVGVRAGPRAWRAGEEVGWAAGLLIAYCASSVLLIGRRAVSDLSHRCPCIGVGDPGSYMWALRWWPYAILHGINPLWTHLAWSPSGANVASAALIPLPSVLMWPVTAAFGPVVAYGALTLLAPAFAATTGYGLCLAVCGRRPAAIAGGWLFGFSSYELSQMIGHANLMLTALLPLLAVMLLWRARDRIGRGWFIGGEAILFAGQLLTSTELLATACGFGALALMTAWLVLPAWRSRLQMVVLELIGAGAIAAAIVSPYVYEAIIRHRPAVPAGIADNEVTDLASLVVPMVVDWVRYAPGVRADFTANFGEQGGYLGGPLLLAVGIAAWRLRRCPTVWILLVSGLAALILSMGNRLQIDGHRTISLPWRLISDRFMFRSVTPDRMIVYVWLAVAVLIALWLAQSGRWAWVRWAVVVVAVVMLLPHPGSALYDGRPDQPALVSTSAYQRVLPYHGQVLILPYAAAGSAMQWQADTNFWFRMPEGYLSIGVPKPFMTNPASAALSRAPRPPISARQLRAFLADFDVDTVLVDPSHAGPWPRQLRSIGLHGRLIDGALVYPVRR